jgi:mRNA interferase RelE/StbE
MYQVRLLPKARKELLRLPRKHQGNVQVIIDSLSINPFLGKKLKGEYQGMWVVRARPYRILYTIDQEIVSVTVVKIGHRQDVYNK